MSSKHSHRYRGMATRRQQLLTETSSKFSNLCMEVESSANKLIEIAAERNDYALEEIASSLLEAALFNQGWLES